MDHHYRRGFGRHTAAKALAKKALAKVGADGTISDRPTAPVSDRSAAQSPVGIPAAIRSILRGQADATVLLGSVMGIDLPAGTVRLKHRSIVCDHLVMATVARYCLSEA